ncbi:hypothetical protein [Psittacicella hinzii]|uniref:Uncharacterized protein n=1 Tax=Psittacicella hinzii TaxID=2028575 RepID=A0A3A1YGL2_9GAMM|nr:hypothetical protein [Psittacicella hinzii]RIY36210.1 hypothetical protein CKF58_06105 [Psittacicella hinzii]
MAYSQHYIINKVLEYRSIVDYIDVLELAILHNETDANKIWSMIKCPAPINLLFDYNKKYKGQIGEHIIRTEQYFYMLLFARLMRETTLTLGKLRRAYETLVKWSRTRNFVLGNTHFFDYKKNAYNFRALRFFKLNLGKQMHPTIDFKSCRELVQYFEINPNNLVKLFSHYHQYNLHVPVPSKAAFRAIFSAIKTIIKEYEDKPDKFWLYEQGERIYKLTGRSDCEEYVTKHMTNFYFSLEYLIANCKDENYRAHYFPRFKKKPL